MSGWRYAGSASATIYAVPSATGTFQMATKSSTITSEVITLASGPYSPPLHKSPALHTSSYPVTFIVRPLRRTPKKGSATFHAKWIPAGSQRSRDRKHRRAENDTEANRVRRAQCRSPRIARVEQTEQRADADDRGPAPVAAHQVLQDEAAERNLFAERAAEEQHRREERAAPGRRRPAGNSASAPGPARPPVTPPAMPQPMPSAIPDQQISECASHPGEPGVAELARFEDGHGQSGRDGGGYQRRHRQGDHLAAHELPDRHQNIEQNAIEKEARSRADERPRDRGPASGIAPRRTSTLSALLPRCTPEPRCATCA